MERSNGTIQFRNERIFFFSLLRLFFFLEFLLGRNAEAIAGNVPKMKLRAEGENERERYSPNYYIKVLYGKQQFIIAFPRQLLSISCKSKMQLLFIYNAIKQIPLLPILYLSRLIECVNISKTSLKYSVAFFGRGRVGKTRRVGWITFLLTNFVPAYFVCFFFFLGLSV